MRRRLHARLARPLSALLFATIGHGLAQVDAAAADALTCAAAVLGPEGAVLTTVVERGSLTYFGPGGQPAAQFDYVSTTDLAGERVRLELFLGPDLVVVQQPADGEAFTFTPQTGVLALPAAERAAFEEDFVVGIYGLPLGAERDAATFVGAQELAGASGDRIDAVTRGVPHSVLLDADCRLAAEVTTNAQVGELVTRYDGYRDVDGWNLPALGEVFVGGAPFARTEATETRVNVALGDDAFARPE
jgi:hypothetical protein